MKPKITDEIKDLFAQALAWGKLEVEYVKLTAAEKLVILFSTVILGAVVMVCLLPLLIMLLLALAVLFMSFMPPSLAYLSVAGIVILLVALIYVFRKPLIVNVVSRFVSRLLLDSKKDSESGK